MGKIKIKEKIIICTALLTNNAPFAWRLSGNSNIFWRNSQSSARQNNLDQLNTNSLLTNFKRMT